MMVLSVVSKVFTKVFGSRNERLVRSYGRRFERVNALESEVQPLSDPQLKARTAAFRQQLAEGAAVEDIVPEALAVAREAMDRSVGIRNILNPAAGFDPDRLPDDARRTYDGVLEAMASLSPVEEPGCEEPVPAWQQVEIPVSLYEAVRALYPESRPPFRARPFDVQLIGGMVLGEGRIAEMKTGEGKTIVAPLACYLAALEDRQCYVVTVNDYLVQRDRDWVFPFYYHVGLRVGAIHPFHMQPHPKKAEAYSCDVVYGTNSEFGFDYLRDNMSLSAADQVQKRRNFCIIDEVDSILIDEARTPLIISGPAHDDAPRYGLADSVARHLMQRQRDWDGVDRRVQQVEIAIKGLEGDIRNARDRSMVPAMREQMKQQQEQLAVLVNDRDRHVQYYEIEMEKKASHLTHEGVAEAQRQADIGSFYVGNNMDFPHLLENALRAHAVYQRDKDYVVQNGEVVIVDEFTGRLMIGRQWSDGLHQAVEAKERVQIKQETQTLATVTIQNYFKLFDRLAGMTGTAVTESTEFDEIYDLEVVCIPTNVTVIRDDRNDLIYLGEKDKWNAIIEEIRLHHDVGRPVLVGTTSVEKSEMLSKMLTRSHGIKHEVLNAKQHEREAHIVQHAGEMGAVMIATNMAGRGTDIRLAPIEREALVHHWQQRNLLPRGARADHDDPELLAMAWRHLAQHRLKMKPRELEAMDDQDVRLALLRHWVQTEAWVEPEKAAAMDAEACADALDGVAGFMLHRLAVWTRIEQMGGLHIVGTERHEARRIDNQLRGRAGRQGDRGSSRFFIALDDDLMQLFAKGWLMKALPKLGMKEGDALEHRMVTRAVERAQRKVEERNFEIRKNLLEYDEVMEYQRNAFYGVRQPVLEGRDIDQIVFQYIGNAVEDACGLYLDSEYVATQVAEWCRQKLDVSIEAGKLKLDDLGALQQQVRDEARAEVRQMLEVTLGEYMSADIDPESWDTRSLSSWAMSRFKMDLKQNQLRRMTVEQVTERLLEAAEDQIAHHDLSPLARFLDPLYAQRDLADWVAQKFDLRLDPKELAPGPGEKAPDTQVRIGAFVLQRATDSYRERELTYPIDFVMEMYVQAAQQDPAWATEQLVGWVNGRYGAGWTEADVNGRSVTQLRQAIVEVARAFQRDGRLAAGVDAALQTCGGDPERLAAWGEQHFHRQVEARELAGLEAPALREALLAHGRAMLRQELTQLERYVLLQILDTAWKDHLYAMDQLKDSVGLRGYAEKDPRIEYKREGANQFLQMQRTVRDRVTELIFRARLTANAEARSVYGSQQAEHREASSASALAQAGTAEQQADQEAARRAGAEAATPTSRRARRAAARQGPEPTERPRQRVGPKQRRRRRR